MNKKLVLLSALALMGSGTLMAQKRVTGRILDTDGQPVYGAHVKVEGTDIVTATDAEGRFTLTNVPSSAKRVSVSYIGMQTQTVSISGNMNVVLEQNDRLLEEAVVVGDSYDKDIMPAKAAGCRAVWLKGEGWTDETHDESLPDAIISDLGRLLTLRAATNTPAEKG